MSPFHLVFAAFIAVTLLEIYLLIQAGHVIGAGWTVFLVVLTAVIGAALVRVQGVSAFARVQSRLAVGELPAVPMLEGLVIFIAGALLLTPGFFTDTLGFLCLVPTLRQFLIRHALRRGMLHAAGFHRASAGRHGGAAPRRPAGGTILEGESRRVDD